MKHAATLSLHRVVVTIEPMEEISLTTKEMDFLLTRLPLSVRQSDTLDSAKRKRFRWTCHLGTLEADAIMELCSEKLQTIGLAEEDKGTSAKRFLETLIDKFQLRDADKVQRPLS